MTFEGSKSDYLDQRVAFSEPYYGNHLAACVKQKWGTQRLFYSLLAFDGDYTVQEAESSCRVQAS